MSWINCSKDRSLGQKHSPYAHRLRMHSARGHGRRTLPRRGTTDDHNAHAFYELYGQIANIRFFHGGFFPGKRRADNGRLYFTGIIVGIIVALVSKASCSGARPCPLSWNFPTTGCRAQRMWRAALGQGRRLLAESLHHNLHRVDRSLVPPDL